MRVAIQYTVELDDIPQEVINLLSEVSFPDDVDLRELNTNISNNNMLKALEEIDNLRKRLSSIDYRLRDCASIITGYVNAVTKEETDETVEG